MPPLLFSVAHLNDASFNVTDRREKDVITHSVLVGFPSTGKSLAIRFILKCVDNIESKLGVHPARWYKNFTDNDT